MITLYREEDYDDPEDWPDDQSDMRPGIGGDANLRKMNWLQRRNYEESEKLDRTLNRMRHESLPEKPVKTERIHNEEWRCAECDHLGRFTYQDGSAPEWHCPECGCTQSAHDRELNGHFQPLKEKV